MHAQLTPPNPSGLCQCGCGVKTRIATKTDRARGDVKGEPVRYRQGHVLRSKSTEHQLKIDAGKRGRKASPETRRKMGDAHRGKPRDPEHVWKTADAKRGKRRTPEQRREQSLASGGTGEMTIRALHTRLAIDHPKTGVCDECEKQARGTHYAFKYHPEPHTDDRADYRELCAGCHTRYDIAGRLRLDRRQRWQGLKR